MASERMGIKKKLTRGCSYVDMFAIFEEQKSISKLNKMDFPTLEGFSTL